ncbi:hypothetical protein E2C01_078560 [Portunus trituberculatus]|uniref:Uncharacterized protein n=1 Tax=Portunus trituberculatus TaxID=210409 RepID=A0A5B7IH84_PORTR|nr:hypothetical protein [Portunus trituberculatus]
MATTSATGGTGGASAIRRDKSLWPKAQMYTTFVLYKENVDTMEAINHIAWKIR